MKYLIGQTLCQRGTDELATVTSFYSPTLQRGPEYDITTTSGNFRMGEVMINHFYSEVLTTEDGDEQHAGLKNDGVNTNAAEEPRRAGRPRNPR